MKRLSILLFAVLSSLAFNISSFGQGIQFITPSTLSNALQQARQQNKLVFLEVYLNGCPHCEALAPVLTDKRVGDVFNPKFVSLKIEANSPESKQIQQQKGLTYPEFPLFFFFDSNGRLLHQASPIEKPNRAEFVEEVNRHAREALDPAKRSSNYASRFAKGDRELMFLINYGKYARATKDTTRLMEIGNLLARSMTKPADLESQMGFYVIQRLIVDYKNPIAQYYFKNLANYKSKYKADDIKNAGEMVLFSTLYGKRTNQLSSAEVVQIRQEMIKLGTPADVAAGRTLLKELEAYFREKNTAKATARFDAFIKTNKVELLDYAYLVRLFNERATDNSHANSLIKWTNNALRLVKPGEQNSKEVAGLYYEQAQAYKRLNNKVEGKRAAEKALAVAKVSGENVARYTALVTSFK